MNQPASLSQQLIAQHVAQELQQGQITQISPLELVAVVNSTKFVKVSLMSF